MAPYTIILAWKIPRTESLQGYSPCSCKKSDTIKTGTVEHNVYVEYVLIYTPIWVYMYWLFCSLAQFCPTLCNPVDCSTPDVPVHHHLQELAQTHGHWVSDAIKASHPLSSCSPPAFNLTQHQGHLKSGGSLHQVPKVLDLELQHQSFQLNIQGWFPLELTGWVSLQSKGLSRVFSNTKTQKHPFFGAQPSLWSNSHIHTWLLEKPQLWLYGPFLAK